MFLSHSTGRAYPTVGFEPDENEALGLIQIREFEVLVAAARSAVRVRGMIILLSLSAGSLLLGGGCGMGDWRTSDTVEILQEVQSPDGVHVATVFFCAGGGAAGYTYTNVNLRKASQEFNQRDILLGKYLWHSFGDIAVAWVDEETLEVTYRWSNSDPVYRERNGKMVPRKGQVAVTYIERVED